jgi:hypothetical protein
VNKVENICLNSWELLHCVTRFAELHHKMHEGFTSSRLLYRFYRYGK